MHVVKDERRAKAHLPNGTGYRPNRCRTAAVHGIFRVGPLPALYAKALFSML